MPVDQVAAAHYKRQGRLAKRAAQRADRLWRQIEAGRIRGSWSALLNQVLTVVVSAQVEAATSSSLYVVDVLEAQGVATDPVARLAPARFAGLASDGRNLASLLQQPAVESLKRIAAGQRPARALAAGRVDLDMIVRTQIADAGRVADGVAATARPTVTGYVRMLSLPSCSRCIVLAGRRYAWNAGFLRHPRCDCRHIPAAEDSAGDLRTNPRQAFTSMDTAEQDRVFGKAGAQAIRDGADVAQVVNARRGLYTAGGQTYTTSGAKRRARLMPEGIYQEARGDRAEAIRLLKLHGFLI